MICKRGWEETRMNENDDLDKMSLDELRALKDEVLLRIELVGSQDAALNPDVAGEIQQLDVLLKEIEERLERQDAPRP
jgi:hypothetical protein